MFETILRVPDFVMVDGHEARKDGAGKDRFLYKDVFVACERETDSLDVCIAAQTTPVRRVRLRWRFRERILGQALGDAWERAYGDLEWKSIHPFRSHPWYVLVRDGCDMAGYGVKVRPAAMCGWQLDSEGITLWLDVRNGGEGVMLNGRRLLAARVVSETYSGVKAFIAAQRFCKLMCDDPILPPRPVYGSNNWYYAYGHSSAQAVLKEADYMANLTRGLENRPYVVIDDGWQQGRYGADGQFDEVYNGGPWNPNRHFGDMRALALQISQRNVIPGIWVRLLQDDSTNIPAAWRLKSGALDPSVPDVLEHVREIVNRIGAWGYKLLKHDFSTFDITGLWGWQMGHEVTHDGWHFADRSKTTAEIIVDFYRAILEAAAPHDMLVLGCNAVGHLGAGLMHMNRIGEDTSGLVWEKTLQNGVNALAFRLPQHGAFFDVDADCMGITEHIDWSLNRQWGELLGKSGTSMFVSVAPDTLSGDQENVLRQMLSINSRPREIAQPLDWLDTTLPQIWLTDGEVTRYHWYGARGVRVAYDDAPVSQTDD